MTETHTPPTGGGPRVTRDDIRDITRLRRARDGRMVAGVAEGISRHFDIDPIIVRVIFGALTFFGGAGIALYGIAWLFVPAEDEHDSIVSDKLNRDPDRVMVAGLAIAGVVALSVMFGSIGWASPNPWPALALAVAALVLYALFSRRSDHTGRQTSSALSDAARPAPPDSPPAARSATSGERPDESAWWRRTESGGGSSSPARPSSPPRPPKRPRPPRSHLLAITMAVTAIAIGTLWLYDASGYDVTRSAYPGTVLAITAAALLAGTWYGRSHLLILVGILATISTMASTIVGDGPFGQLNHSPATAAAVKDTYRLGAGELNLHLMGIQDVQQIDGRVIHIDAEVGQVNVRVPPGLDLTVNAEVDGGEIKGVPGWDGDSPSEVAWSMPDDADPNVTVDIDLRYGQITFYQAVCTGPHSWLTILLTDDVSSYERNTPHVATCN